MASFFQPGNVVDPIYRATRDGTELHHREGRQHLEHIWSECGSYVDPDARQKVTLDLASVFWELHLAYALKFAGKTLVPRSRLAYKNNKGHDLFVTAPDVWLEAVVVRPGHGPDALDLLVEPGKSYRHDPDRLVLRMRSVIRDKGAQASKLHQRWHYQGMPSHDHRGLRRVSPVSL